MSQRDIAILVALASLIVAIEAFYEHPTYGRGVQALLSAARFGELL